MRLYNIYIGLIFLLSITILDAHVMIRSIKNNTDIAYQVVHHNDMSGCSDFNQGKNVHINAHSLYEYPFLLGSEKPGLVLQPVGYYDKKSKIYYSFLNDQGSIDRASLQKAFNAWQKNYGVYKKGIDIWFDQWLCGDIAVIHNHVEFFGYLSNEEMTIIQNNKNFHSCMINYSEGLFSRLFLDIHIEQKKNKGIVPHVQNFVGQGGFCQDGKIITLA